jgi:predicted aldo/keto reductase-like oxidoreductase
MQVERRTFLKQATIGAMLGCFPASLAGVERVTGGPLERRALGRTGETLSIIGFGGIVVMDATTKEAAERVAHAIDRGVNYFDVAPSYGDAEAKLGPTLQPYRKGVFLACKTQERMKDGALKELEASLGRMRTDHFDLYQLHAVTTKEDVATILGPGGALEAFVEARKAGKVRFLGFSAHSVEAALALIEGFAFDTILFPVNFATWHAGHFGPQVLDAARRAQMGILALKAMARRPWPDGVAHTHRKCWYQPLDDAAAAGEGLRFTLSHPITAAIPPGDETLFAMALDLAARFEPLSADEAEAIKRKGLETTPLFRG